MIRSISFTGKVAITKELKKVCSEKDIKALKKYADDINGDLYIESAEKYKTGEMIYKGFATVNNRAYDLIFDTKNPFKTKRTSTQMPAEYY